MKKQYIFILTGVMSLALIGIIVVQLMWISNAVEVRKQQFDNHVNHAMRRIVGRLDARMSMRWLAQRASGRDMRNQDQKQEADKQHRGQINFDFQFGPNGFEMAIRQHSTDSAMKESLLKRRNAIKKQLEEQGMQLTTDSLQGLQAKSAKSGKQEKQQDDYRAERYKQQMQRFNMMMRQLQYEVEFNRSPLANRLQLDGIDRVIERELHTLGIDQEFEYAIAQGDSLLSYKSEGFDKEKARESHVLNLFPNDIFNKDFRLYLHFPEEKQQIYSSLGLLLAGSGFFTLAILVVFTITLWIILRQKKISEIKTDFINNMTHEFKTPIATIGLAADTITSPKILQNSEKISYFASKIKEENKRMNMQVENILQMAMLEKKDFHLNRQQQDIHELIRKAIDSISLQVEKRNGAIAAELDASRHNAEVDQVHFTNVIYNLLENANKYSSEAPKIRVVTADGKEGLYVSVSDQGIGMSQELKNRIFDRFYRVPTGNVHNVKGFGIGLSYVKAIVSAHGGTIRVKSKPGKGSTFDLFIPYAASG